MVSPFFHEMLSELFFLIHESEVNGLLEGDEKISHHLNLPVKVLSL